VIGGAGGAPPFPVLLKLMKSIPKGHHRVETRSSLSHGSAEHPRPIVILLSSSNSESNGFSNQVESLSQFEECLFRAVLPERISFLVY